MQFYTVLDKKQYPNYCRRHSLTINIVNRLLLTRFSESDWLLAEQKDSNYDTINNKKHR